MLAALMEPGRGPLESRLSIALCDRTVDRVRHRVREIRVTRVGRDPDRETRHPAHTLGELYLTHDFTVRSFFLHLS